jgi:hypothetical protein
MASFIIMTSEEADQVRGPSAVNPAAALEPVERMGGVFILGVEVLDDPAHAAHKEFLSGLPTKDSGDPDFPGPMETQEQA